MSEHITYGLDLAKRKFHIVAIDGSGKKLLSKKLMREELACYFADEAQRGSQIAMEACGGCNYWYQELSKLGFTNIRLLRPKDVKPYANSRQKNDSNDALAIAKAARDTELKAVQPKSKSEQEVLLLHKIRSNCIAERVAKSNSLMSSLLEFGYVSPLSKGQFGKQADSEIKKAFSEGFISEETKAILVGEAREIMQCYQKESTIDKRLVLLNKASEKAVRLQTIPGIGVINASQLSVLPMESYDSPRDFAASLGLVPSQHTTGGKIQLGSITKQGNRYARKMLIQGARTIVMQARSQKKPEDRMVQFAKSLLSKNKGFNKTAVAVANKLARIAYAVTVHKTTYKAA
jgi:transposase